MKIIETDRLRLVPTTEINLIILSNLWRNPKVRQFLGGVLSDEAIAEKIITIKHQLPDNSFRLLAVINKATDEAIGLCGLQTGQDGIELSYMFFPEWWGKGIATEAANAVLIDGFKRLKLDKIVAITQEANLKSCQMLEKHGMKSIDIVERFGEKQKVYVISAANFLFANAKTVIIPSK